MSDPAPIRLPTEATLEKYGLTLDEWLAFIPEKDGVRVCPICEKPPTSGRFVTDHKHVPRYYTLAPEVRKVYVRGVTCNTCNRFVLTRFGNVLRHKNAAVYLEKFERRVAEWKLSKSTSEK